MTDKDNRGRPRPSAPNKQIIGFIDQLTKRKGKWIVIDRWLEQTFIRRPDKSYWTRGKLVKTDVYTPEEKGFFKKVDVKIVRFVQSAYPNQPPIVQLETWRFAITPHEMYDKYFLRVIESLCPRGRYLNSGNVILLVVGGAVQPIFIKTMLPSYTTKLLKTETITGKQAIEMLKSGEALRFEGSNPMGHEAKTLRFEETEE